MWTIFKSLFICFMIFGGGDCEACEILAHWPGINSVLPALEDEVLTTGPLGKSQWPLIYAPSVAPDTGNGLLTSFWWGKITAPGDRVVGSFLTPFFAGVSHELSTKPPLKSAWICPLAAAQKRGQAARDEAVS